MRSTGRNSSKSSGREVLSPAEARVRLDLVGPDVYLMVITEVIPKELSVNGDGLAAFIKVWEAISSGTVEPLRDDQPVGDTSH